MHQSSKFFQALALCSCYVIISPVRAQDTVQSEHSNVTFNGYIEPYFAYDLHDPNSHDLPFLFNYSRHNEFAINLAMVTAQYEESDVRGVLSLQTGTYPLANYSAEPPIFQSIYQAYAGVQFTRDLWVDLGVFPSHIGIETAKGNDNWTLTRSLCADNSPYFETGLRANWDIDGPWSFGLYLLNGWQNIRETNSNKAIGTQVQYSIASDVTINSSTFFGNEKPDIAQQWRIFHDFYIIADLTKAVSISGTFDIGWEQRTPKSHAYSRWHTLAIIGRWEISETFALAARGEYFNDPAGVIIHTGTPNNYMVTGYSINADYGISDNALFRIEAKHYKSLDNIFFNGDSPISHNTILTSAIAINF